MSRSFFLNKQGINLGVRDSDPSDGIAGSFYFHGPSGKLRVYNGSAWKNVGSGSGFGDVDTLAADSAEEAVLADYTQSGLEILASTGLMHQDAAFRLIHQAASTRSFKKTLAVDSKFRGKNLTIALDVKSSAQSANLTLLVRDETNSKDILAATQIQTDSYSLSVTTTSGSQALAALSNSDYNTVRLGEVITGPGIPTGTTVSAKNDSTRVVTMSQAATASATITARLSLLVQRRVYSFPVDDNCASLSWTISALAESNSPESYFDDIALYLTQTAKTSTSITTTTYNSTAWSASNPPTSNITNATRSAYQWRQVGENIEIQAAWTFTGAGALSAIPMSALLPAGYSADASKMAFGATAQNIGGAYSLDSGVADYTNHVLATGSGTTWGIYTPTAAMPFTPSSGDTIAVRVSIPVSGLTNSTTTTTAIPLTSAVLTTEADSALRIGGFSTDSASTNTRILRLLSANTPGTILSSKGSAIKITDSTSAGAAIQVLQDGIYSFVFTGDMDTSLARDLGFSLNSANLTTDFTSLPTSERLAAGRDNGSASTVTVAWTGYLNANDIVRIHTGGGTVNSGVSTYNFFEVSYVGKTKIINPSSDQKIELPSSEARLEGCSALGSTDTAVLKFDTIASLRGDGFSISNTAANGTVVTVLKDGKLDISFGLFASAHNYVISRNTSTALTSLPTLAADRLAVMSTASTYGNASWKGSVRAGDVFRIMGNGAPTSDIGNSLVLRHEETKVGVALSNVTPQFTDGDGYLELNSYAGYGSSRTRVVRFSNLVRQDSVGKFVYADSTADGASVTVTEDGVYFFGASMAGAAGSGSEIGFSKNENLTATGSMGPSSMTIAQGRIGMSYTGSISGQGFMANAMYYGFLNKGDVIRVKSNGTVPLDASYLHFQAVKVGKPSLTAVDVTPFINLRTSAGDVGELTQFATSGVPDDYLVCDGAAVSRSTYRDLFNAIGSAHGQGDGSTTFNLPDYRGRFLRGVDGTAGNDPDSASRTAMNTGGSTGNNVGSVQADELKSHTHAVPGTNAVGSGAHPANADNSNRPITTNATGGNETRPKNAYVTIGIRWRAANPSIVSTATTYRMSDYLANGTRVTGADPTALGQYRTFTRIASSRGFTDDAPSTAPSASNGMAIYAVNGSSAGTSGQTNRWRIFIGKNKNYKATYYASTGRTGNISTDVFQGGSTEEYGIMESYDPTTGVLDITLPVTVVSTTSRYVGWAQPSAGTSTAAATSAYFDVTVFDTPFVSQTPVQLAMNATGAVQTSGSANTTNFIWPTVVKDTLGYNPSTGNVTAPKDGWYSIQAYANTNAVINTAMKCYIDGVPQAPYMGITYSATGLMFGSGVYYAKKGQLIAVRSDNNWSASGATGSGLSVAYIGSTYL